jgi:hypothetical protein
MHYRFHKNPSLDSILSKTLTQYFFIIRFNINIPPYPRSSTCPIWNSGPDLTAKRQGRLPWPPQNRSRINRLFWGVYFFEITRSWFVYSVKSRNKNENKSFHNANLLLPVGNSTPLLPQGRHNCKACPSEAGNRKEMCARLSKILEAYSVTKLYVLATWTSVHISFAYPFDIKGHKSK